MKRLMSVILAISLLTSIFAMQGFADGDSDVVIYDAAQLDTFKDRTRQSVTDEYLKALPMNISKRIMKRVHMYTVTAVHGMRYLRLRKLRMPTAG